MLIQAALGFRMNGWNLPRRISSSSEVGLFLRRLPHTHPVKRQQERKKQFQLLSSVTAIRSTKPISWGMFSFCINDFIYGWMTTVGIQEQLDVQAALDYLQQRKDIDSTRLGAMGFSMSGAIFIVAQDPRIRAIVADSPFASLAKIVESQFFFIPDPLNWAIVALTSLYAKGLFGLDIDQASPEHTIHSLATPLLLIHGETDSQIPADHSRILLAKANPELTTLWLIPGADHGHAHAIAGIIYELRILEFFTKHLN